MKKMLMMAAAALAVSLSAQEYKVDLDSPKPWKKVGNYNQRLKIETKELKGKKAVQVTFAGKDGKADTAFILVAPDYPVSGKKTITVSCQVLASAGMKGFGAGSPNNTPGVRWYDADGKEILPMTRFALPEGNGEFRAFSKQLPVPPNARTASVQLGFDYPDVKDGQIFALADILIKD